MVKMQGKYALMEMLRAEGVTHIFGNPGTSEAAIMDALQDYQDIQYYLVLQESVAIGMADAYARSTGEVGFVNLHIDNGLGNAFALLIDSKNSGTPLVITAGNKDVRKVSEGRSDLARMAEPFCKWSVEITHPEQYPSVLRRAFNEARTPPTGPVFISFSANSLDDEADVEIVPSNKLGFNILPSSEDISKTVDFLIDASDPIMIIGDRLGQYGGIDHAVRVAEKVGAKVYGHVSNQVNFPTDHKQYLGEISLRQKASRDALNQSDLVFAIGCPVFSDFFYQRGSVLKGETKLIHLDINGFEIGKSEPTDLGILASPGIALNMIADSLDELMNGIQIESAVSRSNNVAKISSETKKTFETLTVSQKGMNPMSPASMFNTLASTLPDAALIFNDSISNRPNLSNAMKFNKPGSMFANRGGSIGWGIGAGMGLKLANREKTVIAILGDGSAMMSLQGLWTAVDSKIPVIYVICNNSSYRILKLNMEVYLKTVLKQPERKSDYIGMDFRTPLDFASLADSFGAKGIRVTKEDQIPGAITSALNSKIPVVIDMIIDGSI